MSASNTGESTASIVARGDDAAWLVIRARLRPGARLRRVPKLKRSYLLTDAGDPSGPGISDARLRKLLASGTLAEAGIDTYMLADTQASGSV